MIQTDGSEEQWMLNKLMVLPGDTSHVKSLRAQSKIYYY